MWRLDRLGQNLNFSSNISEFLDPPQGGGAPAVRSLPAEGFAHAIGGDMLGYEVGPHWIEDGAGAPGADVEIGRRSILVPTRYRHVLSRGLACVDAALRHRSEHLRTDLAYPETIVRRTTFIAGGGLGWRISALETPRETPAPWKIVVITGAPSWAEYWAPVLAALPQDREMVVVNRPGFAASEPLICVGDIRIQAAALAPLLDAAPHQRVLLVGQSYGAAIATLMAELRPGKVTALVLLSSFLGEAGPTARWLVETGTRVMTVIPRDLRNAVLEVSNQQHQLRHMHAALPRLNVPVHVLHGDRDDFAPIELAEKLARETRARRPIRFEVAPGANHFMTDGPAEALIDRLERCIPPPAAPWRLPLARPAWLTPKALRSAGAVA
jgi:pimeloyl-ACP methyl ester carboxylesterase